MTNHCEYINDQLKPPQKNKKKHIKVVEDPYACSMFRKIQWQNVKDFWGDVTMAVSNQS